jgi:tetratricopeptide (TPR) repeat protein
VSRDLTQLRDEIALREASLLDARRELESGELSLDAFATIVAKETNAIELARAQLVARDAPSLGAAPPPRRRIRRARLLVVALTCFALALGVLLWSALSARQAGNSATGSLSLGHAQQISQLLSQAEADIANGQPVTALAAYRQVLALDPNNVAALTQTGWLDFSAGSSDRSLALTKLGLTDLRRAITLAPRQPAAHLYYAIAAASTSGNRALAKSQLVIFLSLKPSATLMKVAAPFLASFGLSGS